MDLPERVSLRQASDYLGHPTKCIHGRFIRLGLLPWPDRNTLTWHRDDIEALKRWLDARRIGDTSVPRPRHETGH